MQGEKPVAALLRSSAGTSDEMSFKLVTTIKEGYMIITDFENSLERVPVRIYPNESTARASADGQRILKVKIEREL
jgi:hypothetical protein